MSNEYEVRITVNKPNYAYAIEKLLVKNGWVLTGSGQDLIKNERDLWMVPPEGCEEAVPKPIEVNLPDLDGD